MTNSRTLLVRSIPLSREVSDAWRENGGVFLRRNRNGKVPAQIATRFDAILNLGNTDFDVDGSVIVYNAVNTVVSISTPLALRRTLDDYIPSHTHDDSHWHKSRGFGGIGKVFHNQRQSSCSKYNGESQSHIDGNEYRIITVGDKIVQASLKHGSLGNFQYEWVGVEGVRQDGFIPHIKEVVERIPGGERSVLGFDIIHDGTRPWTIEINTSPGVNTSTARRIINALG